MSFHRILCPVDFSSGSRAALRTACELASASRATLVIVHVIETRMWVAEAMIELTSPSAASEADRLQSELTEWKAEARKLGVGEVKTELLTSATAWDRIVDTAREGAFDLIVIGSHGRTGLARAVIGSVAENVVRHASCPVLVVPLPRE
ncbi:MAG: universal stress protein [Acidobacteriota bacterium]